MTTSATACAAPWNELRLGADLMGAVFRPRTATRNRGRGQAVVVVPGFGTNDGAMRLVHRHLRGQGYETHGWGLGINIGPTKDAMRGLAARVRAVARAHGGPVHLVGWSMGGILARVVAARCRAQVGRVVSLGSPLSGDPACSWLSAAVTRLAGTPNRRRLRRMLAQSASVPVTSIYSRRDGVVHWRASVQAPGDVAAVEVDATHLGMVVAPKVLAEVVRALSNGSASRSVCG